MSKDITKVTSMQELQAAVASKYDDIAKQISRQINAPTGNAIRLQNKHFVLQDGTENEGPMRVVVLGFGSRNTYYSKPFNANEIVSPDCYAEDSSPADMKPSKDVALKQADSCNECPQNQWGSAPAGGNGKACQNTRIVAILPIDAPDADIMTIRVSPSGLRDFDAYMGTLSTQYSLPPFAVTTSIAFDPKVSYAKLIFSSPEPNPDFEKFAARIGEVEANVAANFPPPEGTQYE